jgi:hypothetical protein
VKSLLILLILVTKINFSQELYVGNAVLFSIASGITEGLKLEERQYLTKGDNPYSIKLNRLWHKTQFVERGLGVSLGVTIGEYSDLDWKKMLLSTFLSAAIFWNFYDSTINLVRGFPVFYKSGTSLSFMDDYADFKIPILTAAILLNYFYYWVN